MSGQPIKIAILAIGGEGGGVLSDWIVELAEQNGWLAQATSVPGVAQRTGATIYYVELFPRADAEAAGLAPVLALMPMPGDVDIVLASELMEAARAVQRGLVTPDRTTLIASTHRVWSIGEKTALGDGRVDGGALAAIAQAAAARWVAFDMAAIALGLRAREQLDVVDRRAGALRDAGHRGRLRKVAVAFGELDDPVGQDAAAFAADSEDRDLDGLGGHGAALRTRSERAGAHRAVASRRSRQRAPGPGSDPTPSGC